MMHLDGQPLSDSQRLRALIAIEKDEPLPDPDHVAGIPGEMRRYPREPLAIADEVSDWDWAEAYNKPAVIDNWTSRQLVASVNAAYKARRRDFWFTLLGIAILTLGGLLCAYTWLWPFKQAVDSLMGWE